MPDIAARNADSRKERANPKWISYGGNYLEC